jgi:hypothetical protein
MRTWRESAAHMRHRILTTLSVLALTLGVGAPTAHAAQQVTARTPYVVSMSAPAGSMTLGNTMRVTGTVTGAGATKVVLQQRTGTTWSAWTSATVVGGKYTLNYKPVTAGPHAIRAYVSGTTYHSYGISAARTVTVYKWNYLSSFDTTRRVAQQSFENVNTVANINGQAFTHSLKDRGTGVGQVSYVEYNLSRACLTFRMTAGVTDESASGSSARIEVQTDGVQQWARTMSLGQSQYVSLPVSGGLRLHLEDTIVTAPINFFSVFPAFGDARVLCSF